MVSNPLHSIIGGALMSFLDTATHHAGVLAGIYLVNAVVAPLTLFYAVSSASQQLLALCNGD
jgi:acyl-CoA hydrolase